MAETIDEIDIIERELKQYPLFLTEPQVCEVTGLSEYTVRQVIPRADLKNRIRRYKKTDIIAYYTELKSCHQSTSTKECTGKKTGRRGKQKFTAQKFASGVRAPSFSEALASQTAGKLN